MARAALKDIQIFNPYVNQNGSFNAYSYYDHGVESQENFRNAFPVTDQCERSAQLMGDDYVRLKFNLTAYVPMAAFSFIRYDGQTFFLMNDYCPQSKGSVLNTDTNEVMSDAYEYDVKFYSVANMLRKPICYRHVKVPKENSQSEYYEWDEPEISVSATLETMYVLIVGSIAQYVSRLQAAGAATANYLFPRMLQTLVDNGLGSPMSWLPAAGVKLTAGTELSTFSFNGDNIADVCTAVANQFSDDKKETEWYIIEDANHSLTLHFCKCEDDSDVTIATDFSQKNRNSDKHLRPIITGGLSKVEYSRDTSNIPQVIVPYGAERNMTYAAVKGIDEISHMQSTFGKRVRLKPETDYDVWRYAADGVTKIYTQITTDIHGGILNDQVTTGVEKVEFFEDVYPQCHFQITKVDERIKRQDGSNVPEYTCEGDVVSESGVPFIESDFFPIKIEEGTTLSVRFESGFLNGREFEIANKSSKKNAQTGEMDTHYTLRFTIVADGSIEDGTLIPSGNFKPMVGDKFALFNMKMPEAYITYAQGELAQKAYEKLLEYQETVPDVKCTTNPRDFAGKAVAFGKKYKINSEKIGFTIREVEIDGETRMVRVPVDFLSRITAYSYKLTKPDDIQFTLSSALVRGVLSEMASAITSVANTAGGLGQRSINLSRRGWRDASEIADMLDSIRSEMMLIGNEKYQFGYTMSIEPHDASHRTNEEQGSGAFNHLHINYGTIQHTQQPYVDYPNAGMWEVGGGQEISTDDNGDALVAETPYFVYADCQNHAVGATATIGLYADKQAGDDYMLLGILSSEYEHQRVFSRTNGFTAIAGGTITTEQIQDANRQLIIDFQSNPPRIIAKRGAQIIGNITFISSDGAETNLATKMNNVDEELAKEIGGENLLETMDTEYTSTGSFSGYSFMSIPFKPINNMGNYDHFPAGKYVFSAKSISIIKTSNGVPPYGISIQIVDSNSRQYNTIGALTIGEPISRFTLTEEKRLFLRIYWQETAEAKVTINEAMLQRGDKPTAYQSAIKYLAEAFEHDARQLTTSIDGGLIVSALLKLINQDGDVTAGMSGLKGDNVLLWGGATYQQALNAALHDYFLNGTSGDLITTLLKKDGTGKIGCFRVVDNDTISVDNGGMRVYITLKSIQELTGIGDLIQGSVSQSYSSSTGEGTLEDVDVQIPLEADSFFSIENFEVSVYGTPATSQEPIAGNAQVKVKVTLGGTVLTDEYGQSMDETVSAVGTGDGRSYGKIEGSTSTAKTLRIRCYDISAFRGYYSLSFSYKAGAESDFRCCVIAKDGLMIASGHNRQFYVKPSLDNLHFLCHLPPYSTDLENGELYVDAAGFVRQKMEEDEETYNTFELGVGASTRARLDLRNFYQVLLPNN